MNPEEVLPWFIDSAKRAGMLESPVVQAFIERSRLDPCPAYDRDLEEFAAQYLAPAILRQQARPFPFSYVRARLLDQGGLTLGTALGPEGPVGAWRIPLELLGRHTCVGGATGSGKSTFLRLPMLQCLQAEGPRLLVFDAHREVRRLLHVSPQLTVLPWCLLRCNPLQPPHGIEPRAWLSHVVDGIGDAFFLHVAGRGYLLQLLDSLYQQLGVYDGSGRYPTVAEVAAAIEGLKRGAYREESTKFSLINRLRALDVALGPVVRCRQGWPVEQLVAHHVVLELDGLSSDHQAFLAGHLLQRLFAGRVAREERDRGLGVLCVIDEAHQLMGGAQRTITGSSVLAGYLPVVRKYGIAMLMASQQPSQLDAQVRANTAIQCMFSLQGREELHAAGQSLLLTPEQTRALATLPVGVAIVRQAEVPEPFVIQVPDVPLPPEVSETQVRASHAWTRELQDESVIEVPGSVGAPKQPGIDVPVPEASQQGSGAPRAAAPSTEGTGPPQADEATERLSKDELDYLCALGADPYRAVGKVDKQLGVTASKGHRLRASLQRRGLVELAKLNTRSRLREVTLALPTEAGKAVLKRLKVKVPRVGIGGLRHRWWQSVIATWAGGRAEIEYRLGGKSADVGVRTDEGIVAFEVLVEGLAKEVSNVAKDLAVGFSRIVLCVEGEQERLRLSQLLRRERKEGVVDVELLRNFVGKETGELRRRLLGVEEETEKTAAESKTRPPPGDLLTVTEAAEVLHVSSATVRRLLAKGTFPVVKYGSAKSSPVRLRRRDVERYRDRHLQVPPR